MTTTPEKTGDTTPVAEDLVTLTIDGVRVSVPKDTLVIRAAEQVGVQIPRFCDHPLLAPVGACRQCLVDMPDAGNGRGFPKPQASCTITVAEGMVVNTQATSPVADKAQQGIMEFLLINHPLDCPVCDKGGECPLQNQAMSNGRGESRFREGVKRTYPKPINISAQVLLDRERCVLCARCTRFSEQIAGDPFIALIERGALQQVGIYEKEPFESYFSGNTIQICPVGALTSAEYRFRSRPFDLVSTPSVAEHDACGSAIRVDHRRGKVMRRLAGNDPEVNEEWITDKDRFAFTYADQPDRLTYPQVRDEDGSLRPASWPEAFAVAARGLRAAGAAAVLTGGRVTAEDAYAYSKFARVALGTNDIDFRARPLSPEETDFLAAEVVLRSEVTYADLEAATTVVLAGLEPEDEAGAIFLRLRKAALHHRTRVVSIAPYASRGLRKMNGQLVATAPGDEAAALEQMVSHADFGLDATGVILVGERLATSPGALTRGRAARPHHRRPARLGAPPGRRPGRARDRLPAHAAAGRPPGGRPDRPRGRRDRLGRRRPPGCDRTRRRRHRGGAAVRRARRPGHRGRGPRRHDRPGRHPRRDRRGLVRGGAGAARDRGDPRGRRGVPGGPGRRQGRHLRHLGGPPPRVRRGPRQPEVAAGPADPRRHRRGAGPPARLPHGHRGRAQMQELGPWDGDRATAADAPRAVQPGETPAGALRLATWKQMIDNGSMLDGDRAMHATARKPVARVSPATYAALHESVRDGAVLVGDRGEMSMPVVPTEGMVDDVVWVPANSVRSGVLADLASPGSTVTLKGAAQ